MSLFLFFFTCFIAVLLLAGKFLHDEEQSHLPPLQVKMPSWWYDQD